MSFLINSYNIGTNVNVTLQHVESGLSVPVSSLGHLMETEATQQDTTIKVVPITNGGKPLLNNVYMGWNGHMTFTRANGNLTGIMAALEKDYYDNGHLNHFNMLETVLNGDGTIDQYMFTAGVLSRHGAGNYRADKEVDMRIDYEFQRMVLTAGYAVILPILGS